MSKKEVIDWLNAIEGEFVAIDEGGICLVDCDEPEMYCEVGGTPKEVA